MVALAPVAVAAEKLAVPDRRRAALAPRRHMVRLHLTVVEDAQALRADPLLLLVDPTLDLLGEGAQTKFPLIAGQEIFVDASWMFDSYDRTQIISR